MVKIKSLEKILIESIRYYVNYGEFHEIRTEDGTINYVTEPPSRYISVLLKGYDHEITIGSFFIDEILGKKREVNKFTRNMKAHFVDAKTGYVIPEEFIEKIHESTISNIFNDILETL